MRTCFEMLLPIILAGVLCSVLAEDEHSGACKKSLLSVECGMELRPEIRDLAGNATMFTKDLTKMTLASFLDFLSDGTLRNILTEVLKDSIKITSRFSHNVLEGDPTKLLRTMLVGLLDLSDQLINITKHFMESTYVGSNTLSAFERLQRMSDTSETILRKMGKTNLATFMGFKTVDFSLTLASRCLDPEQLRDGCILFLDTQKFVIRSLRPMVDQ